MRLVVIFFSVHWEDREFKQELKRLISPCDIQPVVQLPWDRFYVALHTREGGDTDPKGSSILSFPLKFPPLSYYIEQICVIYKILWEQLLYIHLFTDANDPNYILDVLKRHLYGMNIIFNCRRENNHDSSNVLEDFFEMTRFDGLIRPQSNYSIMASKIADFKIEIKPIKKCMQSLDITEVQVEVRPKGGGKKIHQLHKNDRWSGVEDIVIDFDY